MIATASRSAEEMTALTADLTARLLTTREGISAGTLGTIIRWSNAGFRGMEATFVATDGRRTFGAPADALELVQAR